MEDTDVNNRHYHEHPLILANTVSDQESGLNCYGCGKLVSKSEAAYVCTVQNCTNRIILHKKCGELPSQILHPKHPKHPVKLVDYSHLLGLYWCDICLRDINTTLGYQCASCHFDVDVTCPIISIDSIIEGKMELNHKSHPQHPLTLMTKSPSFQFYCDGCGTQETDMAYTCRKCEVWIHKSCALLPYVIEKSCHRHKLTLEFTFPKAHRRYIFECDVCHKRLGKTCWVYYCRDCRFFAHVRCVAFSTAEFTNLNLDDDVTKFPLHSHDISEKLITPFVERVGPTPPDDSGKFEKLTNWLRTTVGLKDKSTLEMPQSFSFLFDRHNHRLRLVSEPSNKMMDEEEDKDEVKLCDVCVTPISSPPYYECEEACKYFVHSICCLLPKTFSPSSSSSKLYGRCLRFSKSHRFKLYTPTSKLDMDHTSVCMCGICGLMTNGRVYQCEECKLMVDVKCASLPPTIRHASHPHHTCELGFSFTKCQCCGHYLWDLAYHCSQDCGFALHFECALLPKSISAREWDRYHPLMLSSDAGRDHPSNFICDNCEEELNMRTWMYYCSQCDVSFHTHCLKAASGEFRNIKFGGQFVLNRIHPDHPLTYNCVTIKRKCDLCHKIVYNDRGFECGSCYFVVCLSCCRKELDSKM